MIEVSSEIRKSDFCLDIKEETDKRVLGGFLDKDGVHHDYQYDKKEYCYRSGITFEEYLSANDKNGYENCRKCPMWKECSKEEHTVRTLWTSSNKMTDDIAHDIDKRIVGDLLKDEKYKKK